MILSNYERKEALSDARSIIAEHGDNAVSKITKYVDGLRTRHMGRDMNFMGYWLAVKANVIKISKEET